MKNWDGEQWLGFIALLAIVCFASLGFYFVCTDEYFVTESKTIVGQPTYATSYRCAVSDGTLKGDTIAICDTKEECNEICENHRNK